jgi:hypothetical protein
LSDLPEGDHRPDSESLFDVNVPELFELMLVLESQLECLNFFVGSFGEVSNGSMFNGCDPRNAPAIQLN